MPFVVRPEEPNRLEKLQRDIVNLLIVTMALASWVIATMVYFRNLEEANPARLAVIVFPIGCTLLALLRDRLPVLTIAYAFAGLLCFAFISGFLNRAFLGPSMFFLLSAAITLALVARLRPLIFSIGFIILLPIASSVLLVWGPVELAIDPRAAMNGKMSWLLNLALPLFVIVAFTWVTAVYLRAFSAVIKELEAAKTELRLQADHDSLTELANERALTLRAEQMIASAKRHDNKIAVLFIDLDGFKAINDSHGHDAGDHVLKHVGALIGSSFREEDACARVGGDEFLVLLNQVKNRHDVTKIADKLLQKIDQPITYQDRTLHVGASIGIAFLPDHGRDFTTLRRHADLAMYQTKRAKKSSYQIYMNEDAA